jgi:hypothetical protein
MITSVEALTLLKHLLSTFWACQIKRLIIVEDSLDISRNLVESALVRVGSISSITFVPTQTCICHIAYKLLKLIYQLKVVYAF